MEESRKNQLMAQVEAEVQMMMRDGDQDYLKSLALPALLDATESELQFMGLYSHSDQETPKVIRTILEERIDQWREEYLYTPEVTIDESKFCLPETSTDGCGMQLNLAPLVFHFRPDVRYGNTEPEPA